MIQRQDRETRYPLVPCRQPFVSHPRHLKPLRSRMKSKDQDHRSALGSRQHGPFALAERPPYLARYREMGFDELASSIEGSLEKMYEPDPSRDRPHTREEFLVVWRLLREKADSMSSDPPPPLNPLEKAYAKRRRTEDLLYDEAPGNPKFTKKDIGQMVRTLDRLDREIEAMEASEEYDARPAPATSTRKQVARRTATKIFEDIESAFERKLTGRRLQWQPAPPGSLSIESIRGHCEERRRWDPEFEFDMGRIEHAYELGPDGPPWMGPDGLDGYLIFNYPGPSKALMECPEIGNAAYVIHKDWESWSDMDKQELMAEAERGGEVTRIPHHSENWPAKVREALDLD